MEWGLWCSIPKDVLCIIGKYIHRSLMIDVHHELKSVLSSILVDVDNESHENCTCHYRYVVCQTCKTWYIYYMFSRSPNNDIHQNYKNDKLTDPDYINFCCHDCRYLTQQF